MTDFTSDTAVTKHRPSTGLQRDAFLDMHREEGLARFSGRYA